MSLPRVRSAAARAAAMLGIAAALIGVNAPPVSAHASLVASSPAYAEVLTEVPSVLTLTFDNRVEASLTKVEVTGPDGTVVDATQTSPAGPTLTIEFAIAGVSGDGAYAAKWTSLSFDGHSMQGTIPFTVGAAPTTTVPATVTPAPTATTIPTPTATSPPTGDADSANRDGLWRTIEIQARLIVDLGLILVGGAVFWLLAALPNVRRAASVRDIARRMGMLGGVAVVAGAIARLIVVAGRAGDANFDRVATAAVATGPQATGFALVIVCGAAIIAAFSRITGEKTSKPVVMFAAIAAITASLAIGFASHAASSATPAVSGLFAALHLVAAAGWAGPVMIIAVVAAVPSWRTGDERRWAVVTPGLRQFAPIAAWCSIALVITGVRNAVANSGNAVPDGRYLAVLLVKVGVIVLIVAPIGLWHHLHVRKTGGTWLGAASGRRTILLEAVAFVAVIAVAAVLSSVAPL